MLKRKAPVNRFNQNNKKVKKNFTKKKPKQVNYISLIEEFNKTTTQNGAISLKTTNSSLVDLFYFTARDADPKRVLELCVLCWNEDPRLFCALISQVRDREKKGEITLGRIMYRWAIKEHPEVMKKSLDFFFDKYGRWDDGFYVTKDTELWEDFLQICADRIKLGGEHSLVIKWMPSEGKKVDKDTKGFSHLCRKLKWKPKKLRQHFAKYRSELVETKLMKKKGHTIKYNTVPGKAMLKYAGPKGAFIRHDKDRFTTWKESKTKKVHTAVLHPLDVVLKYQTQDTVDPLMEEIWNNFKVPETVEDTIVLADVSGSMNHPDGKPMAACLSLSLMIAPLCACKDTVLTFESKPQFHKIKGETLLARMKNLMSAEWGGSTNVQAAFEVILNGVKNGMLTRMPKRFLIISDMQFNEATNEGYWQGGINSNRDCTNFQAAQKMYNDEGYDLPKIVFWNVSGAICKDVPVHKDEQNVSLVSGYSVSILEAILDDKIVTPLLMVKSVLEDERYRDMYNLYDQSKQKDEQMVKHQLDDEDGGEQEHVAKKAKVESITDKTQDMEVSDSVKTE